MSHTISIDQAASRLHELVSALSPGDEIVLTRDDYPIARIVPEPSAGLRPEPGAFRGALTVLQEDDEHLEHFKDYMP
jgi:antitoxin (DNA-binding transcriptional repressor) of toxin-antitoxin stability system